ncbi:MAG TPA: 3-dehydroquinate synthase [Burkholderiales bacterium]|nr:3-dehydroquinate synthase [Burkholderiales bacterium]
MDDTPPRSGKLAGAPENIFLIGLMGAGKTSVGRVLARRLGKTFHDVDHEIERSTGVKVPVIFDIEGEAGFRARESKVVADLVTRRNIVLATGGGAVLSEANRRLLSQNGVVVYLRASVNELWLRTRHDRNRPLLQTADPRARLRELIAERDSLYREIADIIIDTGNQSVNSLAHRLEQKLMHPASAAQRAGGPVEPTSPTSMRTLTVSLGERSYPIYIGRDILGAGELIANRMPQPLAAIVTNDVVAPLYLERLVQALAAQGVSAAKIVLPDGEEHKNWQTLNHVFDRLMAERCERKTTLIALGGGVVGDLGGFAAAVFQRGLPFIQVPTTLLAQVDSAVGGKTAINHPAGKNMIGAFYQPRAVIADTDTLNTLPGRELSAGLAEVIKYGLVGDAEFFEWLEQHVEQLLARNGEALAFAIERACADKARLVALDERESGPRALLNLGHTFGHAIEAGVGYGTWLHGEAVAAGMVCAARLSERLGHVTAEDVRRVIAILQRAKLPVSPPELTSERYLALMGHDKKVEKGKIRYVLLSKIGAAFVTEAPQDAVADVLNTRAIHA